VTTTDETAAATKPTVVREVEAKWRVHPPFVVPDFTGDGTGVASADEPHSQELRAVYWDTSDLRLAREGVTLRFRSGEGEGKDGWHLKLPVEDAAVPDASTGVRDEVHVDGAPNDVPGELRDLLTAYVRTSVLGPVATLVTQRTARLLRDAAGEPLAEVTDDVVSVTSSGHVAGRFREIEVEARGELAHETLRAVGDRLRSRGAVGGDFMPKVVRALGPQATAEPDPPRADHVALDEPAHDAVRSILRRYVRTLIAQDVALRRGGDDAVHKMRVAARRLRSALHTFAPLLDDQWTAGLRDELKWLADSLGQARDSEVQLERLLADLERLPPELVVGPVRERLERELRGDLASGQGTALKTLRSERYVGLLERLVDAAWEPLATAEGEAKTGKAVPALVSAEWDTLAKRVRRLLRSDATAEQWHKARIAAKRTRYAAEAVTPVFGAPAKEFAKRVETVQELLGEHQDAAVAGEILLRMATAPRAGSFAFTLGVLHARQDEAMRRARSSFHELWNSARAPRLRRWLRA
jgi:CHAD domain-containing protein